MHILKWDILKNTKNNHIERVKEPILQSMNSVNPEQIGYTGYNKSSGLVDMISPLLFL